MSLQFDYFYGNEAEQFTFFRIPKVLFRDERFKDMSTDAKLLYGLMLDRMGLSIRNQWLDEIIELMVDVICSKNTYIRINKQEYPHEVVKSRFLKIDSSHIEYIYFALKENHSDVRNIRAFLITTIYRSFETSDNWFSSRVNYDMVKYKNG